MFLQYQKQCKILHRHSTRLKGYDYSRGGAYFVTAFVKDRKCILGEISTGGMKLFEYGNFVHACWNDLLDHYLQVIWMHLSSCPTTYME